MAPKIVYREDLPLSPFDENPILQIAVSYVMLQFPKRLDKAKIRSSVERMIQSEGYHVLGCRLYRTWRGRLRMRIPAEFNSEVESMHFTHHGTGVKFAEHPLYDLIPRESGQEEPHVVGDLSAGEKFFLPEGRPTRLGYYVGTGRPAMGLHFLEFQDATFLTFYYPHAIIDGMGMADFLRSWQTILDDDSYHPPPPSYMKTDPLKGLGQGNDHKLLANAPQMNFPLFALGYATRAILESMQSTSKRSVLLPRSFVERQKDIALKELRASAKEDEKIMLSSNDVVCSWWSRTLAACYNLTAANKVAVHVVHSQKDAIKEELLSGTSYVHNAVGLIPAVMPADSVLGKPLSYTAHKIRDAVARLKTAEQIHAYAALQRRNPWATFPVFGDSKTESFMFTNLTKTNMMDFDLSSAVLVTDGGESAETAVPCTGTFFLGGALAQIVFPGFYVITKDFKGNFYITGEMKTSFWEKVVAEIHGGKSLN